VTYGIKGSKDANLPITKGPQVRQGHALLVCCRGSVCVWGGVLKEARGHTQIGIQAGETLCTMLRCSSTDYVLMWLCSRWM
jgi:hypothetical protein